MYDSSLQFTNTFSFISDNIGVVQKSYFSAFRCKKTESPRNFFGVSQYLNSGICPKLFLLYHPSLYKPVASLKVLFFDTLSYIEDFI